MKISGYRFAAWIGRTQHWFLAHDEVRISHYDSGIFVGAMPCAGGYPAEHVEHAKRHLRRLAEEIGAEKMNAALNAAPPRPR